MFVKNAKIWFVYFFPANFRSGCRKRPARHIELRLKKIVQKSRMEKNIYEKSTLGFSIVVLVDKKYDSFLVEYFIKFVRNWSQIALL